jgi:intein/homing endonuclease
MVTTIKPNIHKTSYNNVVVVVDDDDDESSTRLGEFLKKCESKVKYGRYIIVPMAIEGRCESGNWR